MRGIGIAHGEEAVAVARVIARVQDVVAEDGNARTMRRGGSRSDQHAAAAAHVSSADRFRTTTGSESTSESTTNAYFEGSTLAACSTVTDLQRESRFGGRSRAQR